MEPPLQRKKRLTEHSKSDPIAFHDTDSLVEDGYMLLGTQNKFTNNVKYRAKSAERIKPKKVRAGC